MNHLIFAFVVSLLLGLASSQIDTFKKDLPKPLAPGDRVGVKGRLHVGHKFLSISFETDAQSTPLKFNTDFGETVGGPNQAVRFFYTIDGQTYQPEEMADTWSNNTPHKPQDFSFVFEYLKNSINIYTAGENFEKQNLIKEWTHKIPTPRINSVYVRGQLEEGVVIDIL